MANWNKVKDNAPTTYSYEGGAVYEKTPLNEWLNMLFSSFMEEGFYESARTQRERFLDLTEKMAEAYGYVFVGKAAIFARNELGMRSISQLVAAWLNDKTFENKRAFYKVFMHRPDDVAEIFAAVDYLKGKRSHALVRGSADYLQTLSKYTLGKYKLNSRTYNMYDLINITHAWSPVIDAYMNHTLENVDTWEVKIAGAENEEVREQEWKRLVEEYKLGYMALLRNLNNILAIEGIDQEWITTFLVPQITNETAVKASLIFPYRIFTAYKNLKVKNFSVITALGDAFKIATQNTPKLEGNSTIILDVSGSMEERISTKSNISIKEVGACFAVGLLYANPNCTVIKFGTNAKKWNFQPLCNPFDNIISLCNNSNCGYSTEILPALYSAYENSKNPKRIFIISDMQVMDENPYYVDVFAIDVYHKTFNRTPLYSFDLGNYHTQLVSEYDSIYYITALNDQVFKFINLLESKQDLVQLINDTISF